MSDQMTTGRVFQYSSNLFGIFYFLHKPQVLIRHVKARNVPVACKELGREFAGNFVPASAELEQYARQRMKLVATEPLTN